MISTLDKTNSNYCLFLDLKKIITACFQVDTSVLSLCMAHLDEPQPPFCCLQWSRRLILRVREQTSTWVALVGTAGIGI